MDTEGTVYASSISTWERTLPFLLDAAKLPEIIARSGAATVLVKPNLVEALEPPITTPVGLVALLVRYLQENSGARILISEGCGAVNYDTRHAYDRLGYTEAAAGLGVELIDLNGEELIRLEKTGCRRWPEMHLPRIALESFLLSVPVLKAHSLAGVTLTLKNMMGLVPPSRYQEDGSWKKSAFHRQIQEAVADLNRYRAPDFTLLDATTGMAQAHLWGPCCEPPVNMLAAGTDPVAIDAFGTGLLQKRWQDIGHIRALDGELGTADPLTIIRV
jgi:uncharacterized protein (DUF362 family)